MVPARAARAPKLMLGGGITAKAGNRLRTPRPGAGKRSDFERRTSRGQPTTGPLDSAGGRGFGRPIGDRQDQAVAQAARPGSRPVRAVGTRPPRKETVVSCV